MKTYPLPTESPYVDIAQYVPLLLAAVEAELDRKDAWDDFSVANGYVESLKAWIQDFIAPMTLLTTTVQQTLYEDTLASNAVFDIDLSALDDYAECTDIEIFLHLRGHSSFTFNNCDCFFNADTTRSNYDASRIINFTSLIGTNSAGQVFFGGTVGNSATANLFSDFRLWIPSPHSAHLKNAVAYGVSTQNTTNAQVEMTSLTWNNTAAITSVKIQQVDASGATWKAGSSIRIVGHRQVSVYVAE